MLPSGSLDSAEPSTFDDTAVVAVRIDMNYSGASCSAEVRTVVQGLYVDSTGLVQASDGSLHITYCATHSEVTELARAMRDARLASTRPDGEPPVGVHPLLASEGLDGPFAIKLRGLLLPVMASSKVQKITVYDHSRDEAGHKWRFSVFDCMSGECKPVNIPSTNGLTQTVEGSDPHAPLAASFAKIAVGAASRDPVARLVAPDRPAPGSPEAASLSTVFESSLRVEQPKVHNSRTTDCVNCHLAEGARRTGTAFYGLDPNASKSFGVDVDRRDDRTSVSNLHAFGYLGREVSVMRRTALEATETAARMTALKL